MPLRRPAKRLSLQYADGVAENVDRPPEPWVATHDVHRVRGTKDHVVVAVGNQGCERLTQFLALLHGTGKSPPGVFGVRRIIEVVGVANPAHVPSVRGIHAPSQHHAVSVSSEQGAQNGHGTFG